MLSEVSMKLYLDDKRDCPPGWIYVSTAKAAIALLAKGIVEELSLDHDLGEPVEVVGTGYDVVLWLEEQVFSHNNFAVVPNKITVHSANVVGRRNMLAGIANIERLLDTRERI